MEKDPGNLSWLKGIIEAAERVNVTELTITQAQGPLKRLHLKFSRPSQLSPSPVSSEAIPTPQERPSQYEDEERFYRLKAPLTGIFYHRATPDQPPFVNKNAFVEEGQVIGIVETMKIMNEVVTDQAGTVVEIVPQDKALVQQGDTLMIIDKTEIDPRASTL